MLPNDASELRLHKRMLPVFFLGVGVAAWFPGRGVRDYAGAGGGRARLQHRCNRALRRRRDSRSGSAEFRDFFAAQASRSDSGAFFQFTFVDDVDRAFGPITAISAVGHANIGVGTDVLRGHDAIGAAVGLARDDGDLGHGGFGVGEEQAWRRA